MDFVCVIRIMSSTLSLFLDNDVQLFIFKNYLNLSTYKTISRHTNNFTKADTYVDTIIHNHTMINIHDEILVITVFKN